MPFVQPKIYKASDHDIDPAHLDADAVHVLKRLREAGFTAYLVGGSVRDLLLKKTPKDFDISTSARPEQIKQVFQRNCILIGRRFRLAHVRFGHKILEVSTFRSGDNESDLIVQDNIWGTPEEDVLRRDFTVNGLYYDPVEHIVIDFVGGWDDIHKRTLKTIGDPVTRFKQDPVRMIRLLKFQARFGFRIDSQTQAAMGKCYEEIIKSSPARILEEILRMLESGASAPFMRFMTQSGLLELLFPSLTAFLKGSNGESIYKLLKAADAINTTSGRKTLDRSVLASCLLYPILEREIHSNYLKEHVIPHFGQIMLLASTLIKGLFTSSFSHFPKRISTTMHFILTTQYRLTPLSGKRQVRPRLFQNNEFNLALHFLKIRAIVDEGLMDPYSWWTHHYRHAEKQTDRRGHHPHPAPHPRQAAKEHSQG